MFELMVNFSRILFILYCFLFVYSGVVTMLDEAGFTNEPHGGAVFLGRIMIILTHITAFLILAYDKEAIGFDWKVLAVAAVSLLFFILANHLANILFEKSFPLIWNCVFFLLDIGLIMLWRLNSALAYRQLVWMVLGFFVAMWIPFILRLIPRFEQFQWLYIMASFALVIATLVLGQTQYGSTNWISFGFVSFQPSEIVKFLFIFYLASVFRKRVEWKELLITGGLSAALVVLFVLEKDLGSALIFFFTYMVMLYIATSNLLLFGSGFAAASLGSFLAYQLFPHVRVRVAAWKDPWADIDDGGYQITQSLFAIGTGGLLGSGLTKGMPNSIPVATKDFIFAAMCEEFGTLFAIGILLVFLLLFAKGFFIAFDSKRRYYGLLAAGITSMMAFQTFLIIGGNIKLIPLTGVTLPFMSYGGSSVVVSIVTIGFLQWLAMQEQEEEVAKDAAK